MLSRAAAGALVSQAVRRARATASARALDRARNLLNVDTIFVTAFKLFYYLTDVTLYSLKFIQSSVLHCFFLEMLIV